MFMTYLLNIQKTCENPIDNNYTNWQQKKKVTLTHEHRHTNTV